LADRSRRRAQRGSNQASSAWQPPGYPAPPGSGVRAGRRRGSLAGIGAIVTGVILAAAVFLPWAHVSGTVESSGGIFGDGVVATVDYDVTGIATLWGLLVLPLALAAAVLGGITLANRKVLVFASIPGVFAAMLIAAFALVLDTSRSSDGYATATVEGSLRHGWIIAALTALATIGAGVVGLCSPHGPDRSGSAPLLIAASQPARPGARG
jgi:hypothetical protein